MVRWCAVLGCSQKKKNKKGGSLFKLPAVIRHSDEMARKMSERRRIKWLARINRKDLTASQLCESRSSLLVCSRHFVSGKPSGLFEDKNIDWAPSLYLGHGRDTKEKQETEELEMDCTPAPKKKKTIYDDMDWVTVRVELSKQQAKLQRCATKLKTLSSQKDKLIGKIECLQILANIDLDLLARRIKIRKHPEAKEEWDKLYCLVMTIKAEEDVQKMCEDEEDNISDMEDLGEKKKGGLRKKHQRNNPVITYQDVACQCQEKKKTVQAIGVQTDVNIFTQLPDLTPKNKEQVYPVLEYGKEGQNQEAVIKVKASDDSHDKQRLQSQDSDMTLASDFNSKDTSCSKRMDHEVIEIPGASTKPVSIIPVTGVNQRVPKVYKRNVHERKEQDVGKFSTRSTDNASYSTEILSSKPFDAEVQDSNIPDFISESMDMLATADESDQNSDASKQNITTKQEELKKDSEPPVTPSIPNQSQPTQSRRNRSRPGSVVERKVVIKKIQHPFLVQSPSNSTALVMSNSNRGGQYKVFRRETICKICGKVFPSMMDQQIHARIDHLGKKVYECEICGKKFSYENDLRRHTMYHKKQKNYQCSECGKTFVSQTGLVSHIEGIHRGVKYRCEICGQEYNRKNSLRLHLAGKHNPKKHSEVPQPPPPPPPPPLPLVQHLPVPDIPQLPPTPSDYLAVSNISQHPSEHPSLLTIPHSSPHNQLPNVPPPNLQNFPQPPGDLLDLGQEMPTYSGNLL